MGRVYSVANQKGGVGKTTTVINLGAYLAHYGQRVLIIDIDPQANATSCLGINKHNVKGGIYDVIIGTSPAIVHVFHNPRLKLSLIPSTPALAGAGYYHRCHEPLKQAIQRLSNVTTTS
jgi:chromosome partitioning protein